MIYDQDRKSVSVIVYPDSEATDSDPNIGNAAVADGKAFHVLAHLYDGSNSFVSWNELNICVHFMLWQQYGQRQLTGNLEINSPCQQSKH
jgi:hypothetical protein